MTGSFPAKPVLYYFHDPMCSWCWGFRPVWLKVQQALGNNLKVQYVLGGLAPDTDQVMPAAMQIWLQHTWQKIQRTIPGTMFNYDFWTSCTPRRSTYPACRAVIASKMQHPDFESKMILAIQRAYYLQARNPSDDDVLIQLAAETGLDIETFVHDFYSDACREHFNNDLSLRRQSRARNFPSLALLLDNEYQFIKIDYASHESIISEIIHTLNANDSYAAIRPMTLPNA